MRTIIAWMKKRETMNLSLLERYLDVHDLHISSLSKEKLCDDFDKLLHVFITFRLELKITQRKPNY